MIDDDLFLKELQEGFVIEALELVDQCEQECLGLEDGHNEKTTVEALFGYFHTIKGTAASVDMQDLADYTHKIENLLVKVKNSEIPISAEIVSILLEATDISKQFLLVTQGNSDTPVNTTPSLSKVEEIINGRLIVNENTEIIETISGAEKNSFCDISEVREEPRNIGDILLDDQMINDNDLEIAVAQQERKIGEIMVDNGAINHEQLSNALDKQKVGNGTFGHKQEEYIRLPLSKIDGLLDYLGEQVILQTSLSYCRENKDGNEELMDKAIVQLNKITQDLQHTAISLRMLNLKSIFKKAQRLVRDTSLQLGKNIIFAGLGEETELDKIIIDEISGPVTHLIRNAVDHGIENSADRLLAGKCEQGTVELQAFQKSGHFYLVITDDGKGLDTEQIRDKAIKLNLIKDEDNISEEKLFEFIFHSGFSTKEVATDVSGRGVGMNVVKTTIEKLRGTIQVRSKKGMGSSIIIKLPLTLAIFNGMVIRVANEKLVVPNSEIIQIINKSTDSECRIDNSNILLRDNDYVYPMIDLRKVMGIKLPQTIKDKNDTNHANKEQENLFLITNHDSKRYALKIDEIIGQQKIVLKKLPSNLDKLKGVSGATILGDGTVCLILDISKTLSSFSNAS